jgi:hypothetical protein
MSDKAAQAEFIKKARALAHHSQPDSGIGEEAARPAPSYLERRSTNHLDRGSEKSSACAIAPDLREQNIFGDERYVAQTKDDLGWREII